MQIFHMQASNTFSPAVRDFLFHKLLSKQMADFLSLYFARPHDTRWYTAVRCDIFRPDYYNHGVNWKRKYTFQVENSFCLQAPLFLYRLFLPAFNLSNCPLSFLRQILDPITPTEVFFPHLNFHWLPFSPTTHERPKPQLPYTPPNLSVTHLWYTGKLLIFFFGIFQDPGRDQELQPVRSGPVLGHDPHLDVWPHPRPWPVRAARGRGGGTRGSHPLLLPVHPGVSATHDGLGAWPCWSRLPVDLFRKI